MDKTLTNSPWEYGLVTDCIDSSFYVYVLSMESRDPIYMTSDSTCLAYLDHACLKQTKLDDVYAILPLAKDQCRTPLLPKVALVLARPPPELHPAASLP